jgi:hypothetical protein
MNAPVSYDPVEEAWSLPIDKVDVSQPRLFQDDTWGPYFARLRRWHMTGSPPRAPSR